MMTEIGVNASGPIFDGRAEKAAIEATEETVRVTAVLGASMVRSTQNVTYRTQTPYARLQTEARRDPPGWKIWQQHLIYGPWLEGTGSRNRTTRFKGYWIFRRTTGLLRARVPTIAGSVFRRFVDRMN